MQALVVNAEMVGDLVDVALVDLGVGEDLLDELKGRAEEILARLLKTGTGE